MLINCDLKAIEWLVALYLSRDKVGIAEWLDNRDLHSENQKALGLPERRIAKIFLFRLIYGGSAYSYANDPDFNWVSSSDKWWQKRIDAFYEKYKGLHEWHIRLVQDVSRSGYYEAITGRRYVFQPPWERARTKILNYPVQGLAADVMALARVSLFRRMKYAPQPWTGNVAGPLFCSSVHDSLVLDSPAEYRDACCTLLASVVKDLPSNFEKVFQVPFDLEIRAEIAFGANKADMEPWNASV